MNEIELILPVARQALETPDSGSLDALQSALSDGAADNLLKEFSRLFLIDKIDFYSLVHENNLILHSDDDLVVAYKVHRAQSQFLYSNCSKSIEYMVKVPADARTGHYRIDGYDPRMSRLELSIDSLSLTDYRTAPLKSAEVVSHDAPDEVLDMENMSGGCTIKFQLNRAEPYEIVFSRDTHRAVGGYQSSYRASALTTLIELVSALDFKEFEAPVAKLVDDPDPFVAWEAIRALDVFNSTQLDDALARMTQSSVHILRTRAAAAIESRGA